MAANFEYYKIFYYVAKYQNFTLAAKALLSSQPSVSRCMQALETELGCRLFIRTKRGVSLTAEGEQLYQYVAPACEQIAGAFCFSSLLSENSIFFFDLLYSLWFLYFF